ncbi:MAG: RNA polymerase sigma factor, partial [Planctomycetota bacterium]
MATRRSSPPAASRRLGAWPRCSTTAAATSRRPRAGAEAGLAFHCALKRAAESKTEHTRSANRDSSPIDCVRAARGTTHGAGARAANEPPSILQRVAAGKADAINECLSRFHGLVWSLARRLGAGPADAEDAVQEIFIDLWKSAERF